MSAFPSSYIRDKVLDKVFRNTNFTSPSSLYLALFETDPTVAGSGDEVSGGSYARQSVTFSASASGLISTSGAVNFSNLPEANIPYWAIFDASTSGNLIAFGALPNTISTNDGDNVTINSGDIDISFSGS